MQQHEIEEIIDRIEFRDWRIIVRMDGDRPYLQVQFDCADNWESTGRLTTQYGRKWMLSEHMTTTEIVNTAWFAAKTAVEHEAREEFKYRGVDIFNTHTDVETLVEVAHNADRRV